MVFKRVHSRTHQMRVIAAEQQPACEHNSLVEQHSDETSCNKSNNQPSNSGRTSSSSSSDRFTDECVGTSTSSTSNSSNQTDGGQLVHLGYFLQVPMLTTPRPVWAHGRYSPTIEGLHDEIVDLYNWLKPTAEEIWSRRMLFNEIAEILKGIWPCAEVEMFGSVATNSFLPSSDIDICVMTESKIHIPYDLNKVADVLRKLHFSNVIVVDKTAIPLIKCEDQRTQLRVDINFNLGPYIGRTVSWIQEKINDMPYLEPLLLSLKLFLAQRGFNNPFNGGLPSYALVVMIVHYLETIRYKNKTDVIHRHSFDSLTNHERKPLGLLLHYFFFYYSYFDYSKLGIKIVNREREGKSRALLLKKEDLLSELGDAIYSSSFVIADPVKRGNNLGRSAHNIGAISSAFWDAYRNVMHAINFCNFLDTDIKQLYYWGPMLSLLITDALLGGRDQHIERARDLLGARQLLQIQTNGNICDDKGQESVNSEDGEVEQSEESVQSNASSMPPLEKTEM